MNYDTINSFNYKPSREVKGWDSDQAKESPKPELREE